MPAVDEYPKMMDKTATQADYTSADSTFQSIGTEIIGRAPEIRIIYANRTQRETTVMGQNVKPGYQLYEIIAGKVRQRVVAALNTLIDFIDGEQDRKLVRIREPDGKVQYVS